MIWIREIPGNEEEGSGGEREGEEGSEREREEILTKRGVQAVMEDREALGFPWRDKTIHDVAETVDGLADEPVFILFTEYADEKSQMDQQKVRKIIRYPPQNKNERKKGRVDFISSFSLFYLVFLIPHPHPTRFNGIDTSYLQKATHLQIYR